MVEIVVVGSGYGGYGDDGGVGARRVAAQF